MPKPNTNNTRYQNLYELTFPWVARDPKNSGNAICRWCQKVINISTMGKSALESHAKSKKHQNYSAGVQKSLPLDAFMQLSQPSTTNIDSNNQGVSKNSQTTNLKSQKDIMKPSPIQAYLLSDEVTRAEILWCLRTVRSHLSIRSSADCVALFPLLFPDSEIAKKMQLQKSKLCYSIVYGLAPCIMRKLTDLIAKCELVVLEFDESMNSVSRKTQMDLHVRFWDHDKSLVVTRYFDSVFLKRTRANDLLEGLKESFGLQNISKILQLSMDGPNVNLKLLNDFKKEIKESFDGLQLLEVGTCSLHVLHGAFKTGISKTNWEIVSILKACYYMFHDSPARRAQYTEITKSSSFPKSFCGTRWVENANAAERAVEILDNIRTYIAEMKIVKTVPQSASYKTVSQAIDDKLLAAKLTFFGSTARLLEPFLLDFQSDVPMAPFLYDELHNLLNTLMRRVVKSDILENLNSLMKINLQDEKNLIETKRFEVDFATRSALKKIKDVSEVDLLLLKKTMRTCIIDIIEKLRERSPLKYNMTRGISCLSPEVSSNRKIAERRLSLCLEILVSSGRMSGSKADCVKLEFIQICGEQRIQDKMKSFKKGEDRLDQFWIDTIKLASKPCQNFRDFVQIMLILSHGNAAVERGFSVNSEIIVENQTETSLTAQRRIYDAIQDANGVDNFNVDKKLIHSFRNAYSLYKEDMKKIDKETIRQMEEESIMKRKQAEIRELESKRAKMISEASKISLEIENLKK